MVIYQMCFCVNRKSKMAAIEGHNFNILTIFENKQKIPETRNLIEPNIDMINLWIVACNFYIFLCRSEIQIG
jgi:hypothetical protein